MATIVGILAGVLVTFFWISMSSSAFGFLAWAIFFGSVACGIMMGISDARRGRLFFANFWTSIIVTGVPASMMLFVLLIVSMSGPMRWTRQDDDILGVLGAPIAVTLAYLGARGAAWLLTILRR